MTTTIESKIQKARETFHKNMPLRMTCPCCKQSRKKEYFGVRLINGKMAMAGKESPKFYRQSHCATCRG